MMKIIFSCSPKKYAVFYVHHTHLPKISQTYFVPSETVGSYLALMTKIVQEFVGVLRV